MSEETDEADEEEGRNSLEYDSERWAPIGIEERESRVDEDPEDEIDGEGRGVRLDRRDFLKITGLGAAAALGPEVGYKAWWKLWDTPDGTGTTDWQRIPKGQEHFVPTVCQQCQGGCGIIARVIETPPALPQHIQDASWDDGRIVKIDGNPSHPVSEGSTCPKGQASLQAHYHPERIRQPLKRVGEPGSNQFEQITWEKAIDTVSEEMEKIRRKNKNHTVTFLDGEDSDGSIQRLFKRFMEAYGSPNYVRKTSPIRDEHLMIPPDDTDSKGFYDFSKAGMLLNFNFNFLESFYSPVQAQRAYAEIKEKGGKIVTIGSRLSVTAIKSHDWIPAIPGTEGLLALAIARIIIEEQLYDEGFVDEETTGFAEFRKEVLKHSVDDISAKTGVPAKQIRRLAHEFTEHGEDAIAIGNSGTYASESVIQALNLLTGSAAAHWRSHEIEIPFAELDISPTKSPGDFAPLAESKLYPEVDEAYEVLVENMAKSDPYPVSLLFVYYADPLVSTPNSKKMEKVLEEIPFVVNFSPFLDKTARYSDIILPDHSPLERRQDAPHILLDGTPVLGLRQPVTEPRYDTRHAGDTVIQIAKSLDPSVSSAFPWGTYGEYLESVLKGIYDSGEGEVVKPSNNQLFYHRFKGEEFPVETGSEDFDAWLESITHTAWWDPEGRKELQEGVFHPEYIGEVVEEETTHLHGLEPEMSEEYPFQLTVFKTMALEKPRNATQPSMFNLGAPQIKEKWDAWVEINTETAEMLSINDGEWVWVESPVGKDLFKAKHYEGTWPGAVNIPLNIGLRGYGKWRKKEAQDPLKVVMTDMDQKDGRYLYTTAVKVYRAEEETQGRINLRSLWEGDY